MLGAPVIRSKERWFPSATASTLSIPPPANPDFCTGCFSLVSKVGPVFGGLNFYWSPSIVDRDNDFGGLLNKGFINYSFYNTLQSSMIFVSINDLGKGADNQNGNLRWHLPLGVRPPPPPPLMAQISRHFLPHFFSFAIESYIYETDFTLQKYHF